LLFFINFKAYLESTGSSAVRLIRSIESEISDNKSIIAVLNPLDSLIETKLTKYIQTAEPLNPGAFTGHIPIGLLKEYHYSGVMLNHSEHKLGIETVKSSVLIASEMGFKTLVCAADLSEIGAVIPLEPDYIAYEPPELIGGNISVSTAKPEIIQEAVSMLGGTKSKLIVGAGIKNRNDVQISKKLGAEGILVASGVVKSPEPIRVIVEMMKEVV
jgi:triosephosphate isomerase